MQTHWPAASASARHHSRCRIVHCRERRLQRILRRLRIGGFMRRAGRRAGVARAARIGCGGCRRFSRSRQIGERRRRSVAGIGGIGAGLRGRGIRGGLGVGVRICVSRVPPWALRVRGIRGCVRLVGLACVRARVCALARLIALAGGLCFVRVAGGVRGGFILRLGRVVNTGTRRRRIRGRCSRRCRRRFCRQRLGVRLVGHALQRHAERGECAFVARRRRRFPLRHRGRRADGRAAKRYRRQRHA